MSYTNIDVQIRKMKISKPRRELLKQNIRNLIVSQPKINNLELSYETGVHRNTITKLLDEIRKENEIIVQERWKLLLNDVTEIAENRRSELNKLYSESYLAMSHSKPSQLVAISKMNWNILKDLYRMHLQYIGIKDNPSTLVQVNINKNKT